MEENTSEGQDIYDISYFNLQQQLQAAVQSLQWTYAIFWRLCHQQKLLVWNNGFYNGGIKTRKTITPEELSIEELSLQRTNQLRELYDMLSSSGESNQPLHRPFAALSPEDLTDAEWFYLLCMSFTFPSGNGLPGEALSKSSYIWLSNACEADNKLFKRALLAKTAQIQTVVCIPLSEGVVELGTTECLHEDASLVEHIGGLFTVHSKPVCSEQSTSSPQKGETKGQRLIDLCVPNQIAEGFNLDDQRLDQHQGAMLSSEQVGNDPMLVETSENVWSGSPGDSTNDRGPELQLLDQTASSQKHIYSTLVPDQKNNNSKGYSFRPSTVTNLDSQFSHGMLLFGVKQPLSSCQPLRLGNPNPSLPQTTDIAEHLSTLPRIQTSADLKFQERSTSAFLSWTIEDTRRAQKRRPATQQQMLKKLLLQVTHLHSQGKDHVLLKNKEAESIQRRPTRKSAQDDTSVSHVLAERRRREKLNERFTVLRNLVPFVTKLDKASILGDAIEYLKQLRLRVQELEQQKRQIEASERRKKERKTRKQGQADEESEKQRAKQESPGRNEIADAREVGWTAEKENSDLIKVSVVEGDAVIEVACPVRDDLLLHLLQALDGMHLQVHFVQASSDHGIFHSALKAKSAGAVCLRELEDEVRRVVGGR